MSLTVTQPWAFLLLLAIAPVVWLALRGARGGGRGRRLAAASIRVLGLTLLTGALAGVQLTRPSDQLSVAFLVDASDSLDASAQAAADAWLRDALAAMPDGDQAAIVTFGQTAMVERLPSSARDLEGPPARPPTGRTDIGAALRLGLAVLPADQHKRLVLLSDGRDTEGQAAAAARMAAASGAALDLVRLPAASGDEAAISQVIAPGQARQGDELAIQTHISSSVAMPSILRLYTDTTLLVEQTVELRPGTNVFTLPVTATSPGFRAFRAEIEPARDGRPENNQLGAFTTVRGPAHVLTLEEEPGEADALVAALAASGLGITRLPASAAPTTLTDLAAYDAVVLVDVPASALGPRMEMLQTYVRDLGRGLVVVGGEDSYGLGGYSGTPLEAALPVTTQLRTTQQMPQVALGLTLDKSGSMGRCHGAPGQGQTMPAQLREEGAVKLDIARAASLQSARLLAPTDEIGIVAFDDHARWVAQRLPVGQQPDIATGLAGLRTEGGTNIYAGLHEATQSMLASQARVKHIILITDGWSRTGDFEALLEQLTSANITLSVVAAGGGSADFLRELAERGGGRYYAATDMSEVPRIFLQETKFALRSYIQEGQFTPRLGNPSLIVETFDALPPLTGYIGTTARPGARSVLVSDERDPLLATWQHGLGRSVAWTSDARGRWASAWLAWPGFAQFWSQTVKWTLPADDQRLMAQVTVQGQRASLTVDSVGLDGQPRDGLTTTAALIAPDGARREAALRQTGPGRYEAEVGDLTEGAHLVTVTQRQGETVVASTTTGLIVGYSPEHAPAREQPDAFPALVGLVGARELIDPAQVFDRAGLAPATAATDLWPLLLLLAVLLLPLDIATRRLTLGWADIAGWRRSLAEWRQGQAAPAPLTTRSGLTRLAASKQRARERIAPGQLEPVTPAPPSTPANPPASTSQAPAGTAEDTLARLRAARQRARREEERP